MNGWHAAHLVALGIWGGIVLAEGVVEVVGMRGRAASQVTARIHYAIDLLFEGPVLLAVLVTGAVLAWRTPLSTVHWVKIALALFAVGINFWCIGVVVGRHRRFASLTDRAVTVATRRVFLAVKLGLPAALAAVYLGLRLGGYVP